MDRPSAAAPTRTTLPPPEWTAPATAVEEILSASLQPLARRKGGRGAEEMSLRARLSRAIAEADAGAHREAAIALARWLASRDRDLDEATRLAEAALDLPHAASAINDDGELRRELAAWLESLGEPGRAAAALAPLVHRANEKTRHDYEGADLDAPEAAYVSIRIGVLHARAGAAAEASAAFEDAMRLDPADPLGCELRGALASWAPEAVALRSGAESYVEAARRRAAAGSGDAELEDVRRAFATDPTSEVAVSALAAALVARGKTIAADEIWRAHASALARGAPSDGASAAAPRNESGAALAAAVHARRRERALDENDVARALGAALDEGLDAQLSGGRADTFDALLLRIGLLDLVAARLDERAHRATSPADRAARFEELARLFAGPLADPNRAAAAHVAAFAADPSEGPAIVALVSLLGDAAAKIDVPGDARLDPLRRFAATLGDVDEPSRRESILGELRACAPLDARFRLAEEKLAHPPPRAAPVSTSMLETLAERCSAPVKAVLLSVAAERYSRGGDDESARRVAQQACHAEPNLGRAVATLADLLVGNSDRAAAAAIERAQNLVGPRASWCAALANALEALDENGYAVAWTQRQVALRPGDITAIDSLIHRILGARDAARLGDALAWVLSQPQPFGSLALRFAEALVELADLDRDRAVVLARRALDVFGPKNDRLREAMMSVADLASDDAFAAAILERWVSSAPPALHRELLVALADRRNKLGDRDAEARVIARAVRDQGSFPMFQERVARLLSEGVSQDGELALMEARAELLDHGKDDRAAASAWRDFGAALWDLASDPEGAVRAWARAANRAKDGGWRTFASDLSSFGSTPLALDTLTSMIETESDALTAGAIAGEASRLALSIGLPSRALELAGLALLKNPSYSDALEIAEAAATQTGREPELSSLYDAVAGRALGRFGRRAAHYRGARYFEQKGSGALALRHAAQAFLAVPTEGATFMLLSRCAERAGDRALAVRTVEQVAERASRAHIRAGWLLRASTLAGPGEDGARRKVEVLLKATLLAPDLGTLSMLEGATRELLAAAPEDRDLLQMRLGRSAKQLTDKLDGPEGARIALAFARLSLDVFEDCDSASESIERAIRMEGDLDDYAALAPYAARLVASPKARDVLDRALASAQKPYASIGVPALKLLAALATHLGDAQAHAQAVVIAAERDPEDDALVLEADVVVRELGDAALVERLGKKVPPSRRVAALRAWAREKILAGAHVEAAAALERAAEIGDAGTKIELEAELRRAYEAAGRGNEIEQRVQREAASDEATPAMRAMRWTEIADRREVRRDLPGTIRALQEAARLDPGPVERWSALERVAELAGDDGVRIGALREIAERVQSDGRIAVHKRLARAYERRGDGAAAEATWHIVLKLDPEDEESDRAMEALIAADGRYAALADHLARRAERLATHSGKRDALRAVRLRRAAILEQRLGRVQDACDELAILLAEWPDNASALRYLADLSERAGDFARAAPLWRRATALEVDPNTQDELELRAASASKSAGDSASALRHVRAVLVRHPESHVALELHVELAREMGLLAELGEALEALATAEAASHIGRSDMLVEAAQSAARIGDAPLALSRAQKAAVIGPERPAPQLLARGLEYRLRGAGDPNDARRTIDDLKKIRGTLAPEDAALRTFLLAEALDVAQGGGAGMRELEALSPELGKSALIAVGIAERMAAQGNHAAALPHFDDALRGNLLGLRKQGSVALAAAESAVRCMQLEDAHRLYQLASGDPESRFTALTRLGHLAVTQGWFERAARILPELASAASTEEHARTLLELVHLSLSSAEGPDRGDAESLVAALFAAIPEGSALRARMQAELAAARRATPSPPSPVRAPAPAQGRAPASFVARARSEADLLAPIPDGTSAAPPPHGQHLEPGVDRELADLEAAVGAAKTPEARAHAQIALAGAYLDQRAFASAEQVLWKALGEGSVQAGDQLAHTLAPAIERSADVVRVRRAQVDLAPGDLSLLEALRAAALADDDKVYARAIEHVTRAFDIAAGPLPPPPLAAQVERPGMMALLTRPSQAPIGEALGLVWEGAPAAFLRDPKTYGITGVGRVVPGSTSAVARLYDTAIRLLDAPRIPLFVSRPTGALSASVALIAPPSVILGGDVREDSPELRFVLGRGMSAALHSNVLVLGMSYKDVSSLRRALASAFGPPEIRSSLDAESSRLAEQFWQLIPPRVQRRLQELLSATEVPEYEELVAPAHQSGRRVGLFLAGDFATAARAVFDEFSLRVEGASASGGLRRYCQDLPALADLLRLAVSPEYADARWQPVAPASQRGSKSSSRFSIV